MTNAVAIYRMMVLNYSETFIRNQFSALSRWDYHLIGEGLVNNGLALPDGKVDVLGFFGGGYPKFSRVLKSVFNVRPFSARRIRRLSPSLIHAHFGVDAVFLYPSLKKIDVPILVTLHGYDIQIYKDWWKSGREGVLKKSYPEKLLELSCDRRVSFLAVSEAIKNRAVEFGIPEEKIVVSYIGVDTEDFSESNIDINKRKNILFVGRLVDKKGCNYLLEAFANIHHRYPGVKVVVVGSGPNEERLRQFSEEKELNVCFLGALSSNEVKKQMQMARVFCLPSIRAENGDAEGFGLVILEAQSTGVPVITSADGGKDEGIIHGQTGFAHMAKDVPALTKYLDALLSDDELALSFSKNARRFACEKYDIKKCTLNLELIYDDAIERWARSGNVQLGLPK